MDAAHPHEDAHSGTILADLRAPAAPLTQASLLALLRHYPTACARLWWETRSPSHAAVPPTAP